MINLHGISQKPLLIELLITRKCCYHCDHCMYDCGPKESSEYMSDEILAKVKKQVNFLENFDSYVAVNLVGGEPTLNFEKFSHILSEVMTWNRSVTMTTNGWWLASQKNIERFFSIVAKYVCPNGKSNFYTGNTTGFNIRISNDLFHEKQRKVKDIDKALSKIFNDKKLIRKYNIPVPDAQDPWLWRQSVIYADDGFSSYYIAPNGRGRNVTNINEWIARFSKDGNFCMKNFDSIENIHYEPNGNISDTCGFGSIYDFGTVDDNIIYILELIWQYKKERWQNRETKNFTCLNCREMVQEWKEKNLERYKKEFSFFNTMDINKWLTNFTYKNSF